MVRELLRPMFDRIHMCNVLTVGAWGFHDDEAWAFDDG
jgi:hypothetical protein